MSVQSPKKKPFDGFTLTLIFIVLAVAVSVPLRAPNTSKAETAQDSNEVEPRVELTERQTELDAELQELEQALAAETSAESTGESDHEYLAEDIQELREEVNLLQQCMLDIYRILEEYSAEHSNVLP